MLPIDLIIDIQDVEKDFGSLTNLCRDLVEKEFHPNSTVTVMRGEIVALKTKDIYETAKWTIKENNKEGPRFIKYTPNPWAKARQNAAAITP